MKKKLNYMSSNNMNRICLGQLGKKTPHRTQPASNKNKGKVPTAFSAFLHCMHNCTDSTFKYICFGLCSH